MEIKDKIFNIVKNYGKCTKIIIYNVMKNNYKNHLKNYFESKGYITEWLNDNCEDYINSKKIILFTTKTYNDLDLYKNDFFLLDYSRITTTTHYIFSVNYEYFNFKDFYEESKNNKKYDGVLWENKKRLHINLGDTIYLYFTNLPDKLPRIMAKGIVIDDGFHHEFNNVCSCVKDNENNYYKISLKPSDKITKDILLGLKIDFKNNIFDDTELYSLSSKCLQSKFSSLKFNNYNYMQKIDDEELIKYIEKSIRVFMSKDNRNTFSYYRDNFNNVKCFFENLEKESANLKLDFNYNHKSFLKENGTVYYNLHHIIEQHNFRSGRLKENIVYKRDNEVPLCLNCHSRIHHGTINDRKKMVNIIYKYTNIRKLLDSIPDNFFKDIKVEKEKRRKYWLLSQYVKEENIYDEDLL